MSKVETTIPFDGFYYSLHDSALHDALNNIFSDESGNPIESLVAEAFYGVDWSEVYNKYAKCYAESFGQEFEFETLTFKELVCPKYYNFETDRIFCEIEQSEVKELFAKVDKEILQKHIKERFTSQSGFTSHYRNDLSDWPEDTDEWDHNQIETLIIAYVEQNHKDFDSIAQHDLVNDTSDTAYNIVSECFTEMADRALKIRDYLVERYNRKYRA